MTKIVKATPEDADFIADGILMAVTVDGEKEIGLPGGPSIEETRKLFADLARRDDSQYSYRNTLIAVDDLDRPVGLIIGYDGAHLRILRDALLRMAEKRFGSHFTEIIDETSADEFYLDTLAVLPEHRKRGVGKALLWAACERAAKTGKPAGLLVAKDNPTARKLYESIGFRYVGDRSFFGEMMDHLQRK